MEHTVSLLCEVTSFWLW